MQLFMGKEGTATSNAPMTLDWFFLKLFFFKKKTTQPVVSNVHRWFLVRGPLSCIVTLNQHFSTPQAIVAASAFLFT